MPYKRPSYGPVSVSSEGAQGPLEPWKRTPNVLDLRPALGVLPIPSPVPTPPPLFVDRSPMAGIDSIYARPNVAPAPFGIIIAALAALVNAFRTSAPGRTPARPAAPFAVPDTGDE